MALAVSSLFPLSAHASSTALRRKDDYPSTLSRYDAISAEVYALIKKTQNSPPSVGLFLNLSMGWQKLSTKLDDPDLSDLRFGFDWTTMFDTIGSKGIFSSIISEKIKSRFLSVGNGNTAPCGSYIVTDDFGYAFRVSDPEKTELGPVSENIPQGDMKWTPDSLFKTLIADVTRLLKDNENLRIAKYCQDFNDLENFAREYSGIQCVTRDRYNTLVKLASELTAQFTAYCEKNDMSHEERSVLRSLRVILHPKITAKFFPGETTAKK